VLIRNVTLSEAKEIIKVRIFRDYTKKCENGCWEWTGAKLKSGYGRIEFLRKYRYIHRMSMYLWRGFDINSKLLVCHHCDNPPCFNPNHLFIGTQKDNIKDAVKKGRMRGGYNPAIGEKCGSAKLKEVDIRRIRNLYPKINSPRLAKIFGVSQACISRIINKKSWKHIQ
jgi:hypothetical protein